MAGPNNHTSADKNSCPAKVPLRCFEKQAPHPGTTSEWGHPCAPLSYGNRVCEARSFVYKQVGLLHPISGPCIVPDPRPVRCIVSVSGVMLCVQKLPWYGRDWNHRLGLSYRSRVRYSTSERSCSLDERNRHHALESRGGAHSVYVAAIRNVPSRGNAILFWINPCLWSCAPSCALPASYSCTCSKNNWENYFNKRRQVQIQSQWIPTKDICFQVWPTDTREP